MKFAYALVGAALATSALALASSTAQAGAWRCVDEADECQDGLINDIETLVVQDWPVPFRLAMPPIPYTCVATGGGGGGGRPLAPEADLAITTTRQINWSIELTGNLTSFLIGQHTAAARVFGTVTVPASIPLRATTWSNVDVSYVLGESNAEVMASGGSTGVMDLGAVQSTTAAGDFWSGHLRFDYQGVHTGGYRCTVGRPGAQITRTGRGAVQIDYPIAWLDMHGVIAEGIRERFRRAVRIAVTGAP
jgi:hypothetical protein